MESAKYILGGLIESRALYGQVLKANLSVHDFQDEAMQKVYRLVMKNYAQDTPMQIWELVSFDPDNSALYVELQDYGRSSQNIDFHIAALKRSATLKRLLDRLTTVRAQLSSADPLQPINFDEAINQIQETVASQEFYCEPRKASQLCDEYLEKIEGDDKKEEFVSVGFDRIDSLLGGFGLKRQEVWGIAAKTGHGKSMYAMNTAVRSALKGYKVLFCTIEMDAESLIQRAIADIAEVEGTRLRAGFLPSNHPMSHIGLRSKDFDKIHTLRTDGTFTRLENLEIIDNTSSITDIERAVRIAKYGKPYDLIVIDYLQLFSPGDGYYFKNSYEAISFVSKFIKTDIAKKHNVAVITCLQVNREGSKKAPHEISQFDIRDSNQVNQDSDWLSVLYHPEIDEYEMKSAYPGVSKLSIMRFDKTRHGETGALAMFDCMGKYLRFEEIKNVPNISR